MFFGYSARSPHRTTKPSRRRLRVVGLKAPSRFAPCKRRGTKVINEKPPRRRGCSRARLNQRDEGAHDVFSTKVPVVPRSKTPTGGVSRVSRKQTNKTDKTAKRGGQSSAKKTAISLSCFLALFAACFFRSKTGTHTNTHTHTHTQTHTHTYTHTHKIYMKQYIYIYINLKKYIYIYICT